MLKGKPAFMGFDHLRKTEGKLESIHINTHHAILYDINIRT